MDKTRQNIKSHTHKKKTKMKKEEGTKKTESKKENKENQRQEERKEGRKQKEALGLTGVSHRRTPHYARDLWGL